MTALLEARPVWPTIVAQLKRSPLRDIAREHGTTVKELEDALRRTRLYPGGNDAAPGTPAEDDGRRSARDRIRALHDLLGLVPDGDIATRAGVARKTVVEYRKAHAILPYRPRTADNASSNDDSAQTASDAPADEVQPDAAPAAEDAPVAAPEPSPAEAAPEPTPVPTEPVAPAPAPIADAPALAASEAPATGVASAAGRPSKLDGHLDIVGELPDRDVAAIAGVTAENVRMYRVRRQIPARWRGEGQRLAPVVDAPAAPVTPARRGRRPADEGTSHVERALGLHRGSIGVLPDADVAAKAGVSRSAVSAYRHKYNIAAAGRGRPRRVTASTAASPAMTASPAAAAPAPAAPAAAPAAPPAPAEVTLPALDTLPVDALPLDAAATLPPYAGPAAPVTHAWRVLAGRGAQRATFAVIAEDAVGAVQRAVAGLRRRGFDLLGFELIGEALV